MSMEQLKAELQNELGQESEPSSWMVIDQEKINKFAEATGDFQWIKLGVNYGLNKVRFPAPVVAGSRVRARSKLIDVSDVPGGLQLIREVTIETEGQEKPCCIAESISRLYF